jgi:hypothetical protein
MAKVRTAQEGKQYLARRICDHTSADGIEIEDLTWKSLLPNRNASELTVIVNGKQKTYPPIGHPTLESYAETALDQLAKSIAADLHLLKR